ncbi:CHAT domain-containing protein [Dactylonectria macrodidyma]|uniref:CHAT domain-containing protein n=1 Tax=Dactylonectria macrodidyma TaxID=307937 RepID=A0A9P9FFE3_9HYPO|nr:CHAT domain-containing protein [Dactylonectria macrodidyma]
MLNKLPNHVALVSMQDTPEQNRLQYASDETRAVGEICESLHLQCIQPEEPCNAAVLEALEACSIIHFAGHGVTNREDPLRSLLLLKDWKEDPLTIGSILDMDLKHNLPFLAYLSACGTGRILDEKSIDESIHIISAFQLIGFRHVVGTLWEVNDELCAYMARLIYEFLLASGVGDNAVSGGLHHASRSLRDEWVREECHARNQESGPQEPARDIISGRDVVLCEVLEPKRPLWAPYVHFGA